MSYEYKRKTPAELEQLAWDVVGRRVWGTWDMDPAEWMMSFMILALMSKEQIKELMNAGVRHLYEYIDKAGPRSVNGMPSFFSAQMLDEHDSKELYKRCLELEALRKQRSQDAGAKV